MYRNKYIDVVSQIRNYTKFTISRGKNTTKEK